MTRRRIQKVLLVNPPSFFWKGLENKRVDFPAGLGHIGAMLKMEGFEVRGLDVLMEGFDTEQDLPGGKCRFGLKDEDIAKRIADFKPDAVGISNMFSNGYPSSLHMCRLVKETDPDIVTVLGGNHPSTLPEACLRRGDGNIDYVVIGEGDFTMGALLRGISRGSDLSRYPGIAYLESDGTATVNQFLEPIHNVDILPWPDRELFDIRRYSSIGQPHGGDLKYTPYTTFFTSRGCPFRCSFCVAFRVHGRTFRPRDPDRVLDELEYLVREKGVREIHFEDDNLTHDLERAKKIFSGIIQRSLDIAWIPTNGLALHNLNREILTLMKDSGCYTVWIAVETGDEDMRRKIRKPTKISKIRELVPMVKELGMAAKGLFMYGFPGETRDQMERTFNLAKELDLDYSVFSIVTPLPGTEIWDQFVELNPVLGEDDFDWEKLKFGISSVSAGDLSTDELQRLRREVWLDVNMNKGHA